MIAAAQTSAQANAQFKASVQSIALGLLEARSEVAGMQALDAAAKGGGVTAVFGRPVCPGKFLVFITGNVAAVQSAMQAGKAQMSLAAMGELLIPAVHREIWPALTGSSIAKASDGMAVLETHNAASALEVADSMVKNTVIHLLRIRLSSGLGGRGLIICNGSVANLTEALVIAREAAGVNLAAARVIPAPHPRLWEMAL